MRRAVDSTSRICAEREARLKGISWYCDQIHLCSRRVLHLVLDGNRVPTRSVKSLASRTKAPVWEAVEPYCSAAELRELFARGTHGTEISRLLPRTSLFVSAILADRSWSCSRTVSQNGCPVECSTAILCHGSAADFHGTQASAGSGADKTLPRRHSRGWAQLAGGGAGIKVSGVVDSSGRLGAGGVEAGFQWGHMARWGRSSLRGLSRDAPRSQRQPYHAGHHPEPADRSGAAEDRHGDRESLKRLRAWSYGEVILLNQHLVTITDLGENTGRAIDGPDDLKVTVLASAKRRAAGKGLIKVQFEYPSPWWRWRKRGLVSTWAGRSRRNRSRCRERCTLRRRGQAIPVTTSGHTDFSDDGQIDIQTMQFTFAASRACPRARCRGPRTVFVEVPLRSRTCNCRESRRKLAGL